MRLAALFVSCGLVCAQAPDPAREALARAYDALRARAYETAIAGFREALGFDSRRASIRKDLAYTYLKIGENELGRAEFRAAMEAEPADVQVAMEYAFLCYEGKEQAQARRIFDRIRKTGNQTAEQAFQNIDGPLAAGIERWKKAIAMGADNFSAHFELATLAERRDDSSWPRLNTKGRGGSCRRGAPCWWIWAACGRPWAERNRPARPCWRHLAAGKHGRPKQPASSCRTAIPTSPNSARPRTWTPPMSSCGVSWVTCCSAWTGLPRLSRNSGA